jgi:multidrug efflux pump subunit AcrA (membrane-fusion protein)
VTMKTISLVTALLACLPACTPATKEAPDQGSSGSTLAPELTNRIDIPATVRTNLGITFAKVEARQVAQTIRVPGAFELQPLARHEYRMILPGRVELLVNQYERVEQSQPLFRFQSPEWIELQRELIAGEQAIETILAEIEVGKAKSAEARRKLELIRERIDSLASADFKNANLEAEAAELESRLPRLDAELHLAETRLTGARGTLRNTLHRAAIAAGITEEQEVPAYLAIDWIEVRALEAGVIETLAVTDGAFVEVSAPVLSTVDPERVRFRASALQGDLPGFVNATEARIVPPRSPDVPIGESVEATLTIGLEAHPEERTFTLLATPEKHAAWIRPGISAYLEVVVQSTESPALAIPRSAIVQDGLAHVFFRRDPGNPNQAIRVEADTGVSDGRWVVLHSGVGRGDEVVLAGAYELKLATQASGLNQKGGHFHADGSFHAEP